MVKFTYFYIIDSLVILETVKFAYFCVIDSLAVLQTVKLIILKCFIINFFSVKHIYIKMSKSYQKEYRDNITDEQEQKRREAIRQY